MNKGKRGSLSLFLCLLLSGIILIGSVLTAAAWQRSAELDIARALDSQIQIGLAAYDRNMLAQFGLLAVRPEKIDRTAFAASLQPPLSRLVIDIRTVQDLFQAQEMDRQIVAHMQNRLPLVYLEKLSGFISGWNSAEPGSGSFWQQTGTILSALPANETQRIAGGLFGGLLEDIQEESAVWLNNTYRRYAAELAGVPADDGLAGFFSQVPDFFSPAEMAQVADFFDSLLNMPAAPVYEKMCLVEYIMGYFTSEVRLQRAGGTSSSLLTIDGRPHLDFPAAREAEIEQILTGINKPELAAAACKVIVVSLRSLIQLGSIVTDETQMTSFRSAAAAVCAAVAALTSGAVVIEPEIMTWLLAAGKALIAALGDYSRLNRGYKVALWPRDSGVNIDLHYCDYLRLLLMAQPRHLLLKRCAHQIGRILPGHYAVSIKAEVIFQGQKYELRGAYP